MSHWNRHERRATHLYTGGWARLAVAVTDDLETASEQFTEIAAKLAKKEST